MFFEGKQSLEYIGNLTRSESNLLIECWNIRQKDENEAVKKHRSKGSHSGSSDYSDGSKVSQTIDLEALCKLKQEQKERAKKSGNVGK